MSSPTAHRRLRSTALLAALAVLAVAALAVPAAAATLTNPAWSVSNSQTGATNVSYTYEFTTATTGTVGSVTMTVPTGTAGTPAIAANYGIGAGSIALSGTTLTYTVTSPASIAAGTPILIEVSGLTNTSTAGDYTSTITTRDTSATPLTIDSAVTAAVTFGASNTAVTAVVPKSLTFTNNLTSFTWLLDPSVAALSDLTKDVTLTVKTNAGGGYTLAVKDGGMVSGANSIPAVSSGIATGVATASFGANRFGYTASLTAGGSSGAALQGALATAGNYVGYVTSVGGENVVSAIDPTGSTADTITITNRVKIDYSTPAGTYTDTITYIVTPSY